MKKSIDPSQIRRSVRDLKKKLNIPYKYIFKITFAKDSSESGRVLVRYNKIIGSELTFNKKESIQQNVLNHSVSHAKHYSMGFPHIIPEIKIKGHDWFFYYTLNEYNTNLIDLHYFKKDFVNFLKNHKKMLLTIQRKSDKEFRKYFSNSSEQIKVELMSDILRFKILCDDLNLGSAPHEHLIRSLKRDFYRILSYDFIKEGKSLFNEKFPSLPSEKYSDEDIQMILNLFNKKRRDKLKMCFWK